MLVTILLLTGACAAAGMGLMAAMYRRDEPLLGAVGLMVLSVAGLTAAAYGVLVSAG